MTHQEMMDQLQVWEDMGPEITWDEFKEIEFRGKKMRFQAMCSELYHPVEEFQKLVASGMSEEEAFLKVQEVVEILTSDTLI